MPVSTTSPQGQIAVSSISTPSSTASIQSPPPSQASSHSMMADGDSIASVSIQPGFAVPGWTPNDVAIGRFTADGLLKCPVPGCNEVFSSDSHGRRYTAEKWKAHVRAREHHHYLWYDPELCLQPPALKFTYIRVDMRRKIAVCHFRREPVQFTKLEEHCRKCKGCLGIDARYTNDHDYRTIGNVTKQQLQREGLAIQGFEACEAYYCCTKLYDTSIQGIHAHMKTAAYHNPTGPVKCMRYRTTKHGYAYVPITDEEYNALSNVHDGMVIAGRPNKREWDKLQGGYHGEPHSSAAAAAAAAASASSSSSSTSPPRIRDADHHTLESFRMQVLSQSYTLFQNFYFQLIDRCVEKLDKVTWGRQAAIAEQWCASGPDSRIFDDLTVDASGYSFLDDSRNASTDCSQVLMRMAQTPQVGMFQHGAASSQQVEQYTAECHQLTELLMVLLFCVLAEPPTASELLHWTYRNTTRDGARTLVIQHGRYAVLRNMGGGGGSGSGDEVHLPWIVGELLVRYLKLVRPFEAYLAQHSVRKQSQYYRPANLQHRIFASAQCPSISDHQFSDNMAVITSQHFSKPVGEHVWKSLLYTIMARVSEKQWDSQTFCEAWYNSTGLNQMQLKNFPKLGNASVL